MGVAFKAPRAPIERPKPPSSRFSFYRRRYTINILNIVPRYEFILLLSDGVVNLLLLYRAGNSALDSLLNNSLYSLDRV